LLIDGKDGDLKGDRALKKGRKVTAYYSSKMTRSYPPQAEGFAIVFGKNNEKQEHHKRYPTPPYRQFRRAGMVREARQLAQIADNIVVKIPCIAEGLKAVRILSAEGIKTNVTQQHLFQHIGRNCCNLRTCQHNLIYMVKIADTGRNDFCLQAILL